MAALPSCGTNALPSIELARAPSPTPSKPGADTDVAANSTPIFSPARVVKRLNQPLCESPDSVTRRLPCVLTVCKIASRWLGYPSQASRL